MSLFRTSWSTCLISAMSRRSARLSLEPYRLSNQFLSSGVTLPETTFVATMTNLPFLHRVEDGLFNRRERTLHRD